MTTIQTMSVSPSPSPGHTDARNAPQQDSGPWWRHPLMWLVVGGPALVVVAGIVTAWIALSAPDPVVEPDYYRKGLEINRTLEQQRALAPAQQGRNHAVTPADDLPLDRR